MFRPLFIEAYYVLYIMQIFFYANIISLYYNIMM